MEKPYENGTTGEFFEDSSISGHGRVDEFQSPCPMALGDSSHHVTKKGPHMKPGQWRLLESWLHPVSLLSPQNI